MMKNSKKKMKPTTRRYKNLYLYYDEIMVQHNTPCEHQVGVYRRPLTVPHISQTDTAFWLSDPMALAQNHSLPPSGSFTSDHAC